MRSMGSVLIVLVSCAVIGLAYFFLGAMKLNQMVAEERKINEQKNADRDRILAETQQIKVLADKQPEWLSSLELFRDAIPPKIDDHVFFGHLADEMTRNNVRLLGIQMSSGGQWLGKIKSEQADMLNGIGVNVDAARKVKTAYYSIKLNGSYADILRTMENLKRYRRLYTIDQITVPTGGGAGTVTQVVNPSQVAVEVSGKLFYGIPDDFIDSDALIKDIIKNLLGPATTKIQRSIRSRGQMLVNGGERTQFDRPASGGLVPDNSAAAAEKSSDSTPAKTKDTTEPADGSTRDGRAGGSSVTGSTATAGAGAKG